MNVKIEQSWKDALSAEFDKDYFKELIEKVKITCVTSNTFKNIWALRLRILRP